MKFSIPDDVEQAFNETFAAENKSAIVADLMRQAIKDRARADVVTEVQRARRFYDAVARLREARRAGKTVGDDDFQ